MTNRLFPYQRSQFCVGLLRLLSLVILITISCADEGDLDGERQVPGTLPPLVISNDFIDTENGRSKVQKLAQHLLTRIEQPGRLEYNGSGMIGFEDKGDALASVKKIALEGGSTSSLEPNILTLILAISVAGLDQQIKSLSGVEHDEGSDHQAGRAIDFNANPDIFSFIYDNARELCIDSLILMPPNLWPEGTHNLYRGKPGNANVTYISGRLHCSIFPDCTISNRLNPPRSGAPIDDPPVGGNESDNASIDYQSMDSKELAILLLEMIDNPDDPKFNGFARITIKQNMKGRTSLEQVSNGQLASVDASNRPHDATEIDSKILLLILDLLENGHDLELWELTTGEHINDSYHYYGRAVSFKQDLDVYKYLYDHNIDLCVSSLITMPPEVWPEGTSNLFVGNKGNSKIKGHTDIVYVSVRPTCSAVR